MKKFITLICFISLITLTGLAQNVTNLILVGDNGVTENIKEAHSFVLIKELDDKRFVRADYKLYGPMRKLKTFSDTALTILEGDFLEYRPSGMILTKGFYENNLRSGKWYNFNDTGAVTITDEYKEGVLIKSTPTDTSTKKDVKEYPDEREAKFKGKANAWIKYLIKKLEASKAAEKSTNGGRVEVSFKVDTTGKTTDIFLRKSVEYYLDEEAISVIKDSPLWEPAFQNGKYVNAYRVQPLTFVKN